MIEGIPYGESDLAGKIRSRKRGMV